jgi:hypothetical protein
LNVPRFRRLPVLGSGLREYSRYSPDLSLRIIDDLLLSSEECECKVPAKDLRTCSVPFDPFLNVVRALTGSKLDDPEIGQALLAKRVFVDDRFDFATVPSNRQDNPAISRYLSTRDQEIARGVILLQEDDVRGHVRVNLGEVGLVYELDHEHGRSAWIKRVAT